MRYNGGWILRVIFTIKKLLNSNLSEEEFFLFKTKRELDFESNDWSDSVIHQIFADTSVEEMGKSGSSMSTHSYQICVNAIGKIQDALLYICIIINVHRVVRIIEFLHEFTHDFLSHMGWFETVWRIDHNQA